MGEENPTSVKEWIPTGLQVLVLTLENDEIDVGDWTGRIKALKNSIRKVKEELALSEKKRVVNWAKMLKEREESEENNGMKIDEFKNEFQKETSELKIMLKLLCDNAGA